jgi:hypothetical protein
MHTTSFNIIFIIVVPFPGRPEWLDTTMAMKNPAGSITMDDTMHPSAYLLAILYNDPLGNPCRNFN